MIWKLLLLLYVFDVAVHQTTSANLFETLVSTTTESHITNFLHQPRADSRADKPKSEEEDSKEDNEVAGPASESTSSSAPGNHHHNHHRQSGEDQTEYSPLGKMFTDFRDRIEDVINVISDRQHLPIHFDIPSHHHHHHHAHHNSSNHTGHDNNEHHQNHNDHHQNHNDHHQNHDEPHQSSSLFPFAETLQTKTRIFSSLILSPLLNLLAGASRQVDGPSILSTLIGGPTALNGQHHKRKRDTESEDHDDSDQHWHDHDHDHHNSEHDHDHHETSAPGSYLSQHFRDKTKTLASIILGPLMGFLADSSRNVDVGPLLSASSGGPNGGGGLVDSHENRKRESNDIPLEMKESEKERTVDRERPISKLLSTISNAVAERLSNKDPLRLDLLRNNGDTDGIDDDQLDFDEEASDESIPDFPFDDDVEAASESNQSRMVPPETAGVFILEIIGTIAGLTWGVINQLQNILRPKN